MVCSRCYGIGQFACFFCPDCHGSGIVSCCEGNPNGKTMDTKSDQQDGEEGNSGFSAQGAWGSRGEENTSRQAECGKK